LDFVEICKVCARKVTKLLRGCLILIKFDVVIVISILASLFLEHSVCQLLIIFNVFDDANGAENAKTEWCYLYAYSIVYYKGMRRKFGKMCIKDCQDICDNLKIKFCVVADLHLIFICSIFEPPCTTLSTPLKIS